MMCPKVLEHKISQLVCEIEGRKNTIYDLPAKGYARAFEAESLAIEKLECKLEAYRDVLYDESGKVQTTAELITNVMFKSRGWKS
jgi:seryl-tRNA(Sec) selenium transferase